VRLQFHRRLRCCSVLTRGKGKRGEEPDSFFFTLRGRRGKRRRPKQAAERPCLPVARESPGGGGRRRSRAFPPLALTGKEEGKDDPPGTSYGPGAAIPLAERKKKGGRSGPKIPRRPGFVKGRKRGARSGGSHPSNGGSSTQERGRRRRTRAHGCRRGKKKRGGGGGLFLSFNRPQSPLSLGDIEYANQARWVKPAR